MKDYQLTPDDLRAIETEDRPVHAVECGIEDAYELMTETSDDALHAAVDEARAPVLVNQHPASYVVLKISRSYREEPRTY